MEAKVNINAVIKKEHTQIIEYHNIIVGTNTKEDLIMSKHSQYSVVYRAEVAVWWATDMASREVYN